MRTTSSSLASRVGKLTTTLLLTASLCCAPGANAINFQAVPSPNLDLSALGRVAFAGDFDAISLYQYEGQNKQATGPNAALLAQLPNGIFTTLNRTDADIKAVCSFVANNTLKGIVVGGNFTNLGPVRTPGGIAYVNATDGHISPMEGLNGTVNALYCDDKSGRVYVGGSFSGGGASNAIAWVTGWTNLPFSGFNGPVNTITKAPNGNIIFGGKFSGLGNATAPRENNTQVVPLRSGNITALPSSGTPGFTDPADIICKTGEDSAGNTWLLADNSPGFWKADFGFGFQPSKLRLYNTKLEGRGTKTWRFTALPDGGIMNFTYTDPTSGEQAYCDARCPLPQDNVTAQDFRFVNFVGMNSFRIDISEWYGPGGGLSGIELFQDDIYTFAINSFNEPQCDGVSSGAKSTQTGPWVITPSGTSTSEYLTATLLGNDISNNSASVVFQPNIRQSGNYSVSVYTPGCLNDNTCLTRKRVKVTGTLTSSQSDDSFSTELYQTNNYEKYDEVYTGFVDATGSFRPSVTIAPVAGQNGPLTIVAQRVRFQLLRASSGNLNGLFEYNPTQQVVDMDLKESNINLAGRSLSPDNNAWISSLAVVDATTYVAGNFTSDNGLNHIFSIGDKNATALPGNGLNNQVKAIYQNESTLFVGGSFTNTQDTKTPGLNGVAAFSAKDRQWQALGAGVNGEVTNIVPFSLNLTADRPEDVLGITGYFNKVNEFGSNASFPVNNFAVWVMSRQNWLHNLNMGTLSIQGTLRARANVPDSFPVYAGSISSQQLAANGAAILNDQASALQPFPTSIRQQSSATKKRAVSGVDNSTGVVTAAFYHENGLNMTILAGHFAATASDGSEINNLLLIDGKKSDAVTGFHDELSKDSTFMALGTVNTILFAGGKVSGTVNNNRVAGVVSYDLASGKFADTQPPALQGQDVTVHAISPRPKSKEVLVGGNFASAGALSCAGLCIWKTDVNQWSSPGGDLSGTVTSVTWVSDTKAIVAGNLTAGSNHTSVLSFDSKKNKFEEVPGANHLPGPVTAICPANNDGSQYWATGTSNDGTPYLQRFDGNKWLSAPNQFAVGTVIRGIQVLSLSRDHGKSDVIDNNQDLLLLGNLNLTDFGTASGVLFNGSTYQPFLLSASSSGDPGSLSQVFVENPQRFFKKSKKHLALGYVVLISLAIALAFTFILVCLGILLEMWRKKRQGYQRAPMEFTGNTAANMNRVPPEHLFGTLSGNRAPAI
ncbi:hypothetical protein GQ43DRAFT_374400 [Delitschia confertaspora ATCC 74209]|uniref:Uncharacterized protein n=1 Tax=Delitschia confertaspora ATCC 74209 TaxID=1513339 RepID=A0A9P4JL19_9PLEO|nr:hypothetical protein GQ43DRAFT_374400 [Delitschia confertaspora ATCC 74209]